jgi:hypothetical protein
MRAGFVLHDTDIASAPRPSRNPLPRTYVVREVEDIVGYNRMYLCGEFKPVSIDGRVDIQTIAPADPGARVHGRP